MATKLSPKEAEVFHHLKGTETFKKVMQWWCDTVFLSGKSVPQQRKEVLECLRKCSKIIVRNPTIAPEKIFSWWFALKGARKPRNLILV